MSRQKYELNESQFLNSDNLPLREPEAEKIRKVIRASLAVQSYSNKCGCIRELFSHMFRDRRFSASMLNGARFLQLVLDSNGRGKLNILRHAMNGTFAGMAD